MTLVCVTYLSWATRNVTLISMNDAKCIIVSVYTCVIMTSLVCSMSAVLGSWPNAWYACVAGVILICTTEVLLLHYVPKVRYPKGKNNIVQCYDDVHFPIPVRPRMTLYGIFPRTYDPSLVTVAVSGLLYRVYCIGSPVSDLLYRVYCIGSPVSGLLYRVSCIGSPVSGLLCRVSCIGSLVSGLLYRVSCIGSPVSDLLYRVSCIGSPVSGLLYRVSCIGSPVSGLLYRVSCIGSPVSGLLYRVSCIGSCIGSHVSGLLYRVSCMSFHCVLNEINFTLLLDDLHTILYRFGNGRTILTRS